MSDRIKEICQDKADKGKCDGSCEEHVGHCRVVEVFAGTKSWGYFSYCSEAIHTDESNGFIVTEVS